MFLDCFVYVCVCVCVGHKAVWVVVVVWCDVGGWVGEGVGKGKGVAVLPVRHHAAQPSVMQGLELTPLEHMPNTAHT